MRKICIVRSCKGRAVMGAQLCPLCHYMLSTGDIRRSTAWFAAELEFLNKQNDHAMEQVRLLHEQVNELMEEEDV